MSCFRFPESRNLNSAVRELTTLLYFDRFKGAAVCILASAVLYGLCDDLSSHYIRGILTRVSWKQYAFAKAAAVFAVVFVFVECGFLLFLLVMGAFMPVTEMAEYQTESMYSLYLPLVRFPVLYSLVLGVLFSCFCSMHCMVGLAVLVWVPNRFVATCIPFLSMYLQLALTNVLPVHFRFLSLSSGVQVLSVPSLAVNFTYCCGIMIFTALLPAGIFVYCVKRRKENGSF